MFYSACIVIPLYKPFERLKPTEYIAWYQCLRVLRTYTICLVHPPQLDLSGYEQSLEIADVPHAIFTFSSEYFKDIFAYNKLMLSKMFYQQFVDYEYMLIYQLDAYVFEDRLSEWCAKGYSYIGAPWFEGFVPAEAEAELWRVGNGGFSLRRIPDFLRVLNSFTLLRSWSVVAREHMRQYSIRDWKTLPQLGKRLLVGNNTYWRFNDYARYATSAQEDYFWGVECPSKLSWYKVPTPQEALAFSFEVHPRKMYELNEGRLPMGCHAWEKYDATFWQEHIEFKFI